MTDTAEKSIAQTLYPGIAEEKYFWAPYDYTPIINSLGKAVVTLEENGYHGDTFVVYRFDNDWGILIFGWGSCSVCDALQGCSSYKEIDKLIEQLKSEIKHFPTLEDLKSYVADKYTNKGSWYYHSESWQEFATQVAAFSPESND